MGALAAAWLGLALSPAALADAPGAATSRSAEKSASSATRITKEQVRQSMEAAGYTGVVVEREGDDWVGRGKLNGAARQLRIDSRTGQAKR